MYALCLNGNNCVFYIPNLSSLVPKSIWPEAEENVNCQREVKLQLGSLKGRSTLKTLQVGKASSWSTGSVASPPSCTAFYRPYSLSDPGVDSIFGIYSTGAFKFVEIIVKTTENTIRYSKPPYKFAIVNLHINSPMPGHVGHMTVSNLLWVNASNNS